MNIQEMIKRYGISLANEPKTGKEGLWISKGDTAKKEKAVDMIRENKAAIMDYLKAEKAESERIAQERRDRIAAIEGLHEIRDALNDLANWHDEWEASFSDVGGMGVRPKPQYDIPGMKAKYPHAAAYLRAEEEASKRNCELSSIGRKALEEVIYGDWQKAMESMDAEIKAFVDSHILD